MSTFQDMVARVANSVKMASLAPPERKKLILEIFKKFKMMGDGTIRGGKHEIHLAAEGYTLVLLEDASDDELQRLHKKYIAGSPRRTASTDAVEELKKAGGNFRRVSQDLLNARGSLEEVEASIMSAAKYAAEGNSEVSDEDTERLQRDLQVFLRAFKSAASSMSRELERLQSDAKESADQYADEVVWALQHPDE